MAAVGNRSGLSVQTAAEARITTSGDVSKITALTVGTSGTDIIPDNVSITAGQTVTLVCGTIQHAT